MLTIKKRFPSRELYLGAGIVTSVAVAGALAAIVSAHSLKDQSAVMPTKVVEAKSDLKDEPTPDQTVEAPVKKYTGTTEPRVATSVPPVSTAPLATSAPSAPPTPTPSLSPEPTPEPTVSPEPSPEPTPDPEQ